MTNSKSLQLNLLWRQNPALLLGGAILLLVCVASLLAPFIVPYGPEEQDILARLRPPTAAHLFGTDQYGRDVLTRTLLGGRTTLLLGISAVTLSVAVGVPFGLVAGYHGGRIDDLVMRITDVFLSFPALLLAMLVVTALGTSVELAILAIGIANIPAITRLVRSTSLSVRNQEFVLAAQIRGESTFYTMFGEILPNILPPLIVEATIRVGIAILIGASLSFLGLGVQPPQADWGLMIREARTYVFVSPWPLFIPGVALGLTIIGINLFGDGLSDFISRKK